MLDPRARAHSPRTPTLQPDLKAAPRAYSSQYVHRMRGSSGGSVAHTENWRNRWRGNLGWMVGCTDGRMRGPGYVQWASSRFKPVVVVLCGCTTKTTVGGESLCARLCVLAAARVRFFPSTETQRCVLCSNVSSIQVAVRPHRKCSNTPLPLPFAIEIRERSGLIRSVFLCVPREPSCAS